MESNVSYNVVRANNRREREIQATGLQENMAYIVNERNITQTDEDNEYSTIENIGRERDITTDTNNASTNSTNTILDNKSNTIRRIRQSLAKYECAKKRFAILAITAFILSLLVAVAALVYTNIELKNQMSSSNKQIQFMSEQLNNQSSQQIQNLQAQLSDSILLLQTNFSEQLSSTNASRSTVHERATEQPIQPTDSKPTSSTQ